MLFGIELGITFGEEEQIRKSLEEAPAVAQWLDHYVEWEDGKHK